MADREELHAATLKLLTAVQKLFESVCALPPDLNRNALYSINKATNSVLNLQQYIDRKCLRVSSEELEHSRDVRFSAIFGASAAEDDPENKPSLSRTQLLAETTPGFLTHLLVRDSPLSASQPCLHSSTCCESWNIKSE